MMKWFHPKTDFSFQFFNRLSADSIKLFSSTFPPYLWLGSNPRSWDDEVSISPLCWYNSSTK
jgi:hypothetical protein